MDWRGHITNRAIEILDTAKAAWLHGDLVTANCELARLGGLGEYAAILGDNWTKIHCETYVDLALKFFAANPKG